MVERICGKIELQKNSRNSYDCLYMCNIWKKDWSQYVFHYLELWIFGLSLCLLMNLSKARSMDPGYVNSLNHNSDMYVSW